MDYKIVAKEAFQIIGKSIKVSTKDGENRKRIPEFWGQAFQDGTYQQLCALSSTNNILGVSADYLPQEETMTYLIATESRQKELPAGWISREIPAATWAIFQSVGPLPQAIQDTYNRIYSEWFPGTGYEHAETPELEVYPIGDGTAPNYRCEVWIPIVKK